MPERRLVRPALISAGLLCGAVPAAASVVVLHGPAMLLVAMAAAVAAAAAATATDEGRPAAVAAAWKAAVLTVVVIVIVAGLGVLGGGAVAAIAGLGCAVVAAVVLSLRAWRRSGARTERPRSVDRPQVPVPQLSTSALASEWRWTTARLADHPNPPTCRALVQRRLETLDELERRDPIGFVRWMAVGHASAGDPAGFIEDDRASGNDAVGGEP